MGYIYILVNESFKDYIKIGYADDINRRIQQLNSTATTPYPFKLYASYETSSRLTDKEVHNIIDTLNPNLRPNEIVDGRCRQKEFFHMRPNDAYSLLHSIALISGTLEKLKKENNEDIPEISFIYKKKAPAFNFKKYGILPGEELTYINDRNIKVKVVDDRKIEYEGRITSMSTLAQRLGDFKSQPQGTEYFLYKGERLTDLRKRLDAINEINNENKL